MNNKFAIGFLAICFTCPTIAHADQQARKAEEMCTGEKTSEDYPRWSLTTNTCSDTNVSVCSIEKRNGDTASYQCTAADRPDSPTGTGVGKKTPKPEHKS